MKLNMFSTDEERLRRCILERQKECRLSSRDLYEIQGTFESVVFGEPLAFDCTNYTYLCHPTHTIVRPDYRLLDSDYKLIKERCLLKAQQIVFLCPGTNSVLFLRSLHDYFLKNIRYDESYHPNDIMGPLLKGVGVCEGISKSFKLCCDLRGIDCITVNGILSGGAHMWCRVLLGGKWYNIDVSSDINSYDGKSMMLDHFLVSDRILLRTHTFVKSTGTVCVSDDLDPYYKNGLSIDSERKLREELTKRKRLRSLSMSVRLEYLRPGTDYRNALFRIIDSVYSGTGYDCSLNCNLGMCTYHIILRHQQQ